MTESSSNCEIIMYHIGPIFGAPSPSSYVIKLMTYMRMANIKYKTINTRKTSSKGKMPFITYNGKQLEDTSFIINFLNKELNIDLNASLTDCDKAIALAFQRLCEENLYWLLVYNRWFVKKDEFVKQFPMTGLMKMGMQIFASTVFIPAQKKNLYGHGMGRHSKEEIYAICEHDLTALSTFLGEKQFFFGDTPTEIDCSLFGLLSEFIYVPIGCEQESLFEGKFSNLKAYCDRIKEKYWSDWDDCCVHQNNS